MGGDEIGPVAQYGYDPGRRRSAEPAERGLTKHLDDILDRIELGLFGSAFRQRAPQAMQLGKYRLGMECTGRRKPPGRSPLPRAPREPRTRIHRGHARSRSRARRQPSEETHGPASCPRSWAAGSCRPCRPRRRPPSPRHPRPRQPWPGARSRSCAAIPRRAPDARQLP